MMAPHELKNKEFAKAVRGYNCAEVDEYIEFIIDKYTELYKANSESEKELKIMKLKYNELRNDEDTIRAVIVKAQKLGEGIVAQAKDEAEKIIETAREKCDAVINIAAVKIDEEKKRMEDIRNISEDFRQKLYEQYIEHIKNIKSMDFALPAEAADVLPAKEKLAGDVMNEASDSIDKAKEDIKNKDGRVLTDSEEAIENDPPASQSAGAKRNADEVAALFSDID